MKLRELFQIIPDGDWSRSTICTLTETELANLELTEGLIQSADRTQFVTRVNTAFPGLMIHWDRKNTPFLIIYGWFVDEFASEKEEQLKRLFNTLGWFISTTTSFERKGRTVKQVTVEPKYDIFQQKLPAHLYHVAPEESITKIMKIGLSPRSKSRMAYHPDRVYVAVSKNAAMNIASQFQATDKKVYAILEIDTGKLLRMTKFYWDKNYTTVPHGGTPLGLYTLSNIPPQALTRSE